jgi:hypothetical protein
MLQARDTGEKLEDLLGAEHHGQRLWHLRRRDHVLDEPVFLQGDRVEKSKGGDGSADRLRGEPLLLDQIHLIRANLR